MRKEAIMTLPKNLRDAVIEEGEDISRQDLGGSSKKCLYIQPGKKYGERWKSDITLMDFALYLKKLNSILSWSFVINECLRFKINKVGTEGGGAFGWRKGEWANYDYHSEVGRTINLNPHINRIEAAKIISEKQKIKVAANEVYYWLWFHEIGHATSKTHSEWQMAQCDFWYSRTPKGTRENLDRLRIRTEKAADRYANKRFLEWKAGAAGTV